MTPEAQRIAIAEAYGFTHVRCIPPDHCIGHHPDRPSDVPDYLNDLNAMHEAEKVLVEHHGLYWFTLAEAVSGFKREEFDYSNEYFLKDIACATAAQRAESLLRTLNKWEESE